MTVYQAVIVEHHALSSSPVPKIPGAFRATVAERYGHHVSGPEFGKTPTVRFMPLVSGGENVEAYGKTAIVGVNGEIEHGSTLIHTLRFGNFLRDSVQSSEFIPFTNKRGGPGPDELLIAIGVATGGRPHHRIGDRFKDMEDLQHDQSVRPDL